MDDGRTVNDDEETTLLARARTGDVGAIGTLYAAHADSARALARVLAHPADVDDLLAEAWARVASRILAGGGPEEHLAPYLSATMRNLHRDMRRRSSHERPASDRPWLLDPAEHAASYASAEPPLEPTSEDAVLDEDLAHSALTRLPATWRRVIVLHELEERDVVEYGAMLHVTPAAVSSLAYRARCGLREAYLEVLVERASAPRTPECAWVHARLACHVRGALTVSLGARVRRHLGDCDACSVLEAELRGVTRLFERARTTGNRRHSTAPPPMAG